jgi:hypothetical protein
MFAQIRRHQKTLWIFISGAVIVSFVWYFNPNQRFARRGGGGGFGGEDTVGSIYGEPIHRAEYTDAYREAVLHYLFSYGEWPQDNEANRQLRPVERETRQRLLLVRKLKEYNIEVSDAAAADWIAQAFQDRQTKTFHKEVYDRFIQQLQQRRLKAADFERYAKHQVGIGHLAAIAGASGRLVTPQQADQVYREEHEQADTKLALFPSSNYVAKVQITPQAVAAFYTNNIARYRLPERVQLSYVAFPASNYFGKADQTLAANTNLAEQIDSLYMQRGPSFYTDPSGKPMTPEAAKAHIRADIRKEAAMTEARRESFAFANDLEKVAAATNLVNPAEPLEKLAQSKSLRAQTTEPFSQFQGPAGLNLPDQFTKLAFHLTAEEPIVQEPVPGEDAFYVVAFKSRIPSETEALEKIRAQVTQDYIRKETADLARAAGTSFLQAFTNAPAGDSQFDTIAHQHGAVVVDLPPFSKDSRSAIENLPPAVSDTTIRRTAFDLSPNHASGYIPGPEGGSIIYLQKFIPVTDADVKSNLPEFTEELRRREASEAFNEWFGKQLQLAQMHLPGDKTDQMED